MRMNKKILFDYKAQTIIELTIILVFVILPLTIGVFEFGRAIHAKNMIINMGREGANLASRTTEDPQDIMDILALTAQPLKMSSNGMIYITKVAGKSDGNIEVVAPVSVPMFVMVPLSGTESVFIPGPVYSNTLDLAPFTPILRKTSRITSLAETKFGRLPVRKTFTTCGIFNLNDSPAIAAATSNPPAPIEMLATPPPVGVWLSLPNRVLPGRAKRSKCN